MADESADKIERVLGIYAKLMNGELVNKAVEASRFGVNERSIQRDIDDIRNFMDLNANRDGTMDSVIYDRLQKGYRLKQVYRPKLSNPEILAICKILLDSRAFRKEEMMSMLDRLIACCVPKDNHKFVSDLILNESFHYVEPRHQAKFLDTMWEIGKAIQGSRYIEFDYQRMKDKQVVHRKIMPLAIMFSEYYFYLTAFIDDEEMKKNFEVMNDSFPTIYRIDRIKKIRILEEKFHIPYRSRFEEGEFRKRVQFMYGGKLQRVKFEYSGNSVEAVLDRLPTAKILDEKGGKYIITAEVFGKGIDMWLRSQGDDIKVL